MLSDDLEMKAISGRYGHSEATVLAIAAGCDAVLMCEPAPEKQMAALEAVDLRGRRRDAFPSSGSRMRSRAIAG